MKRLFLGACLLFCSTQANVEEFLAMALVTEAEQYERLRVMLHVLEEFDLEDRTIMCLYLENLEDIQLELESDNRICFECVALQDVK